MEVILLNDVPKLGHKFEVKRVSPGYARNYLLPHKLVEPSTTQALKRLENLKKRHEAELAEKLAGFEKALKKLENKTISIVAKANDNGHLFESLNQVSIKEAIKAQVEVDVEPAWITIKNPIKEVGKHKVVLSSGDKKGELELEVKPQTHS